MADTDAFHRFTVPPLSAEEWTTYNDELNALLAPIHRDLATDAVSPAIAGDLISSTIRDFLISKPGFLEPKQSTEYISHNSKTLEKVSSLKSTLRKSARKSNDPEEKKKFFQAIRAHHHLLKLNRQKEKTKSAKYQEDLFHKNFFSFSKSVCNGSFGKQSPSPSFDKNSADTFYRNRYSSATPVDISKLDWFPSVNMPDNFTPFNLDPIKPRDIRNVIKSKNNSSAPGPDGITYGILKKLTCTHHILATLYSKLLLSPEPPTSWGNSKITLIYKKGEASDPTNFRMIALSSVLGKTFHLLLSQRLASYLTANNFIDSSIQKAFLNKINGTIEHNQCIQEILLNARSNRRTAHLTFFDLADAFGSVQHNLISHCLQRYQVPLPVQNYIMNLYNILGGSVVTKSWTSNKFEFKKGVYQGDPLSPIVFLIIFNPLIERLMQEDSFGYKINDHSYLSTPFADDFNLITSNKMTHQRLINMLSKYCETMGLTLKPSKCRSISIVSGKSTSIDFYINDDRILTLEEEPHKFLGSFITFSGKQNDIYEIVSKFISERIDNIDNLLIRGEYKLRMYNEYLIPASRFLLSVHTLSSTSINKLESLTRRKIKTWLNLPRCATPSVLHVENLLEIKSIREVYMCAQAGAYISSRTKADAKVNNALDSRLEREKQWTRKSSTIVKCDNLVKDIDVKSASLESSKKLVKKRVRDEMKDHWSSKLKSLSLQGQFLSILEESQIDINWKSLIYNLPRNVVQFFVNSSIDTLPTNSNLCRWNKRSSPKCNICPNKDTLLHSLNNCQTMLQQGRYTWRHDSILIELYNTWKSNLPDNQEIYCDLPGKFAGVSTIPINILVTSLRPDIVVVNSSEKSISILELTVPYDTNITNANARKMDKYDQLRSDLQQKGYQVRLETFEISSRGLITKRNSNCLSELIQLKNKELKNLCHKLQKIVLIASYIIFHSKYESDWTCPPLIDL